MYDIFSKNKMLLSSSLKNGDFMKLTKMILLAVAGVSLVLLPKQSSKKQNNPKKSTQNLTHNENKDDNNQ